MEQPEGVRLDKWLWAVRLYKSRSLAIAACQAGHVKIAGQRVKPAHAVRIGETITAQQGEVTRTVRVVGMLERRVGASAAKEYLNDLTPPEELRKREERPLPPLFHRPKGLGRPTKRDRRLLLERMGHGAAQEAMT